MVVSHERGLVDEDKTVAQIGWQPANLFHGNFKLGDFGFVAVAGHGAHGGTTDNAVSLQAVLALEGFDEIYQFRRIFRCLLISRKRGGVIGLQGRRGAMLDGFDHGCHIGIVLARLQNEIGRNDNLVGRVLVLFVQLRKLSLQRLIFRVGRLTAAQIGGNIRAHAGEFQHGREIDRLALEVMIARQLVRIDAATGRVLHISQNLGGKRQFELHHRGRNGLFFGNGNVLHLRLRLRRDACGHVLRRRGDGIIGRVQAAVANCFKERENGAGALVEIAIGNPDWRAARIVIGFQSLCDLRRRRQLHACQTGREFRRIDSTRAISLISVVARTGNARQWLGIDIACRCVALHCRNTGKAAILTLTLDLARAAAQQVHEGHRTSRARNARRDGKTESQYQCCRRFS